jgi:hypothetical protein
MRPIREDFDAAKKRYLEEKLATYANKFNVAEELSQNLLKSCSSLLSSLSPHRGRRLTLRLAARQNCLYQGKYDVVEKIPLRESEEDKKLLVKLSREVTHTYFKWKIEASVSLIVIIDNDERRPLLTQDGAADIETESDQPPRESDSFGPVDVDVSWLFPRSQFVLDRNKANTPRRNSEVEELIAHAEDFQQWVAEVNSIVSPLLELPFKTTVPSASDFKLGFMEAEESLLSDFVSSWTEKSRDSLKDSILGLRLMQTICLRYMESLNRIEEVLREQLMSAIGCRHISPETLQEFMYGRLERSGRCLQSLHHLVRRGEWDPEGLVFNFVFFSFFVLSLFIHVWNLQETFRGGFGTV